MSLPDGRELDAVLHAEAAMVLGLAVGMLTLDDVAAAVHIDGDQAAVRAIFERPVSPTSAASRSAGSAD
ncbi:hypothetical protein [Mycobacterium kiyosense]